MYERSRKVSRKGSENLDKHLLEALYHRYYKELYIFVYSLCGSETVTDDILQDTFLKALLALKDSHTNMRAWLYIVARNLYYNYYNRQKNLFSIETEEVDRRNSREKIISGEGEAFIQNDILEEILHKEEKKRVWDAVNRLKGQKKEVILLQYFGDFSQKEIAAMLKITSGNVKVLSYRAKKELKEYLTKEEGR